MSNKLKLILLVLFSNVVIFFVVDHTSRADERNLVSKIFQKEIAEYIVLLEKNDVETVKTLMSGFIYPEIIDAGKKKNIKNKKYLCPSWNMGLEKILIQQFNLNRHPKANSKSYEDELDELFKKGCLNMDNLCSKN